MEVQLTADQEAFIRQAAASGRYPSPEAAVRDAMAHWEERERAADRFIDLLIHHFQILGENPRAGRRRDELRLSDRTF